MKFDIIEIRPREEADIFGPSYSFRFTFNTEQFLSEIPDDQLYDRAIRDIKNEVSEFVSQHFETDYCWDEDRLDVEFDYPETIAYFRSSWNPYMGDSYEQNIARIKNRLANYRKELYSLRENGYGYSDDAEEYSSGIYMCEKWLERNGLK